MFDRLPARPSTSGLKRVFGRGRRSTAFVIVIALAASAGLSGTWPSAAVAADPDGGAQSPQYQEWKRLLHHFYDPFPTVEHYGDSLVAP